MIDTYEWFKIEFYKLTKIDLECYKEKQMKRRIDTLIAKHKMKGYKDFLSALISDNELLDEFLAYITINVSEFYRNPDQWKVLEQDVIPELIGKFGKRLTIWSAACSTGEEPYSLVMALSKYIPLENINIYATDLDTQVLEKAKIGIYDAKSLQALPKEWLEKYFLKVGSSYQIKDEIKSRVTFAKHDLLQQDYKNNFHLIVCRNVLIYFTEEAKNKIFYKFQKALSDGGLLFVGSTEQIMNYKEVGFTRKSSFFYSKGES